MRRALLLLIFIVSCSADPAPIRLATNLWPGYEPLYFGRHKGVIPEKKVHLVEAGSASQVIRFYRNGLIDAAALTLDEALVLRSYGYDPVVILVMDMSRGADVLFVKPSIRSLADLRGRRIGYEKTALGAYFLSRILQTAGLAKQDVISVPLEVMEHADAFRSGRVDAIVTFANVISSIEGMGYILFDSRQLEDEIIDVLVVDRRVLLDRPEHVKTLIKLWFQSLKLAEFNRREADVFMAHRLTISVEQLHVLQRGLYTPDLLENRRLLEHEGILQRSVDRMMPILQESDLLGDHQSSLEFFTDACIPEAAGVP